MKPPKARPFIYPYFIIFCTIFIGVLLTYIGNNILFCRDVFHIDDKYAKSINAKFKYIYVAVIFFASYMVFYRKYNARAFNINMYFIATFLVIVLAMMIRLESLPAQVSAKVISCFAPIKYIWCIVASTVMLFQLSINTNTVESAWFRFPFYISTGFCTRIIFTHVLNNVYGFGPELHKKSCIVAIFACLLFLCVLTKITLFSARVYNSNPEFSEDKARVSSSWLTWFLCIMAKTLSDKYVWKIFLIVVTSIATTRLYCDAIQSMQISEFIYKDLWWIQIVCAVSMVYTLRKSRYISVIRRIPVIIMCSGIVISLLNVVSSVLGLNVQEPYILILKYCAVILYYLGNTMMFYAITPTKPILFIVMKKNRNTIPHLIICLFEFLLGHLSIWAIYSHLCNGSTWIYDIYYHGNGIEYDVLRLLMLMVILSIFIPTVKAMVRQHEKMMR